MASYLIRELLALQCFWKNSRLKHYPGFGKFPILCFKNYFAATAEVVLRGYFLSWRFQMDFHEPICTLGASFRNKALPFQLIPTFP